MADNITNELTDKDYWQSVSNYERLSELPPVDAVLEKVLVSVLPKDSTKNFLEIGCCPSKFMVMFSKKLGYHVAGLDYVDSIKDMGRLLCDAGVNDFELFHDDFFSFMTDKTFDVVASFGFVEHFLDTADVIQRHVNLANRNGYVVAEIPNFHYGQGLLQKLFYPSRKKTHNTKLTKSILESEMQKAGLEIVYSNYVRTIGLALPAVPKGTILYYLVQIIVRTIGLLEKVKLDNISNRWFSPYILVIGKKPLASD